jgi:hypothetical protein
LKWYWSKMVLVQYSCYQYDSPIHPLTLELNYCVLLFFINRNYRSIDNRGAGRKGPVARRGENGTMYYLKLSFLFFHCFSHIYSFCPLQNFRVSLIGQGRTSAHSFGHARSMAGMISKA